MLVCIYVIYTYMVLGGHNNHNKTLHILKNNEVIDAFLDSYLREQKHLLMLCFFFMWSYLRTAISLVN